MDYWGLPTTSSYQYVFPPFHPSRWPLTALWLAGLSHCLIATYTYTIQLVTAADTMQTDADEVFYVVLNTQKQKEFTTTLNHIFAIILKILTMLTMT